MLSVQRQTKELHTQMVTLQSEIARDRSQLFFLNKKLAKYTIVAATDGTIFELPINREGAVVQPKQLIAEIAPNTNRLVFKGEIAADRSESLRSGDRKDVKLKFDEFPFESYDIVKGHLTWVSPNSKIVTTPQGTTTNYEVEVQLGQSCVQHEGKCLPFKSGQPATAEIVIRHRKIVDFVLDPFRKLANQGD
jgi:hemolysin D